MGTSNIADKVVVITGASSGIGESTAKHLARHGAKVVLGARRKDRLDAAVKEISATAGKAISFPVDVTKRTEVEALIRGAVESFGRVDVIVNDAGIMPIAPIDALKVEEWDRQIDVNIKGFYTESLPPCLKCRSRRAAISSTWLRFSGSKCSLPARRFTAPRRRLCAC